MGLKCKFCKGAIEAGKGYSYNGYVFCDEDCKNNFKGEKEWDEAYKNDDSRFDADDESCNDPAD
jgi:hypothetical protein